ncbi:glutamine amidotransferase-related protein [Agromyces seonyuensis]|uniref:Glutamine amidotransferase n=1 Tax=Agromyces seonyuensis TaxID=2662446 RepID=A0A6I4NUR6_9MICO|nr:gamma-glutamyl-gamma-aminobutyrate hydrolase family protein [Agromyces seonyuensis]MWB98040.1 glutamine amidotransferase [Agromyces seonyuensis]
MPDRTALVLRHDLEIGLGNLAATLESHGYAIDVVDVPTADLSGLDPLAADLLVVLGGEEGAYETDRFPYLVDEIRMLRARIAAEAPVFGVCLGAQLTAAALGARVYRGPAKEVGWRSIRPTDAGFDSPVRHVFGSPMMQWHGDTFDLPEGVTRLAGNDAYENQAFGIDGWLLAVQFHPEVDAQIDAAWLARWGHELPELGLDLDELRDIGTMRRPAAQVVSAAMLGEFLDGLPARAA